MMHPDIAQVLYDEQQIAERVAQLGSQITDDYSSRLAQTSANAHSGGCVDDASPTDSLLVICILRGAAVFMADLIRRIELPVQTEYISASSYGNEAKSSGSVDITETLSFNIAGRHVLIVEDMIDSGLTLKTLIDRLSACSPASLEVAAMMKKLRADGEGASVKALYTGFECPDEYVVGYGLDFAQRYRNLPYIAVLDPKAYR